jgi:hypothetical protein
MKDFTYKILEDNTIEMWVPDQSQDEPPVLRQDRKPDGSSWESAEEAELWIKNYISDAKKSNE